MDWTELRTWMGFSGADEGRLAALWPAVSARSDAVLDAFYERVMSNEGTRRVIQGDEQLARLRCTMARWMEELMLGPHDDAYVERRQRIGRRHVEVGLESHWMHAAMSVLTDLLGEVADDTLPADEAAATRSSLGRALQLDLALMTGTFVESRERRSLAALQELIVFHLRTIVLLVDHEGRITAATRAFGTDDLVGRPWQDALPPSLREASHLEQQIARSLHRGREITLPRIDVGSNPDRLRSYRLHIVPLDHALARFLLQIEELTDAVNLEGRLRRSEALAQLGALSAAVAHELRNPLAGISGALQVIQRSVPPDAPYLPIMGRLHDELGRLDQLVGDLLAFARQGAVALTRVDLAHPCRMALELVQVDHPEVDFELRGAGTAQADPNLVQQIVLNLLQNAVQALGGPGQVLISVSDGRIEVDDSGPGVPAEDAERVFVPFYTTKTRGTGLGLAICQRYAHAMNGRLSLAPRGTLSGAAFVLELAHDLHTTG